MLVCIKPFHDSFSSEWPEALGSFWGMWFSFLLISCLRILHSSIKCYVSPYAIMSYFSQRDLSFLSRRSKIKVSKESPLGRTMCVTAPSSRAKLAAASNSLAASQQKKGSLQHPSHRAKKGREGHKKLFHRISFSSWKMQVRKEL